MGALPWVLIGVVIVFGVTAGVIIMLSRLKRKKLILPAMLILVGLYFSVVTTIAALTSDTILWTMFLSIMIGNVLIGVGTLLMIICFKDLKQPYSQSIGQKQEIPILDTEQIHDQAYYIEYCNKCNIPLSVISKDGKILENEMDLLNAIKAYIDEHPANVELDKEIDYNDYTAEEIANEMKKRAEGTTSTKFNVITILALIICIMAVNFIMGLAGGIGDIAVFLGVDFALWGTVSIVSIILAKIKKIRIPLGHKVVFAPGYLLWSCIVWGAKQPAESIEEKRMREEEIREKISRNAAISAIKSNTCKHCLFLNSCDHTKCNFKPK